MVNDFLPEARYSPTQLMSHWEDNPNYLIGQIVHVKPLEFLTESKTLIVSGENFNGCIKEEDLTIYPFTYFDTGMPRFLPKLFNHCVTAKIIGFSNGIFELSRKASMQEALEEIEIGQFIEAKKTSILGGKTVFVDISAGISAIIPLFEVTSSQIEDVTPVFKNMDFIPVKIIKKSTEHENRYIVSYKRTLSPKPIKKGDIVRGKVSSFLPDGSGAFIEISPIQIGIVDTIFYDLCESGKGEHDELECFYHVKTGEEYSFIVKRVRDFDNKRYSYHYSLVLLQ